MSFFNSLNTSASALNAQKVRMEVISQNIANVDTTRTAEGTPYKRKTVLFKEIEQQNLFKTHFDKALGKSSEKIGGGVEVIKIAEDLSEGTKKYDPTHPDADEQGYVVLPNVNVVEEMVNMISANRSYEANITAISTTKSMINKTLEIGV